jgi:hypothetical protein
MPFPNFTIPPMPNATPALDAAKDSLATATDVLNSAKNVDVSSEFNKGRNKESSLDDFKKRYKGSLGKSKNGLVFPSELIGLNRPMLELRCLQAHSIIEAGTCVYLPAPEGLSYSNSSTYNDSELGIMGNETLSGLNTLKNSKNTEEAIGGLLGQAGSAWQRATGTDIKSGILAAVSGAIQDEGMKAAVGIAARARFNPYIVTSFDGTNTREYSFEYKLIPSSQQEAETIKQIARLFQIAVYGEVEGFLLKYPPKWKLTILSATQTNDGTVLKPLSSFYECYLQGCDVNYNSSNNSYFHDNSPLETDISLTFKETKALHANEIAKLLITD